MTFWVVYDHLGKLLIVNVCCAVVLLGPVMLGLGALLGRDLAGALYVGLPLFGLTFGVLWPVLAAGLAHMVKELIETRDGTVGAFFAGLRLYGLRAAGMGLCLLFAACCLAGSAVFYAYRLRERAAWLGYGLSALALWGLLFVLLVSIMAMPALVQKRAGVFATLKLSALLVLDNPLFLLGLAPYFVLLAVASLAPPAFAFLTPAVSVVLASSAYEMLSRKYAAIEARREVDFRDAEDDYLNRGLRDFLFPWKS
ncbi:MAG TPA: hypothetical protein PKI11_07630 [Candidatus Hydrogenedentes bacterium]|nr:hypothetical protein [Candidatus Hydrogenedentota bacterium]